MRSAALIAIAGLSLIALAGFALSAGFGAHAQTTTIEVGDFWFCDAGDSDCMTTDDNDVDVTTPINVGDTVEWQDIDTSPYDIPHTVTQCGATCNDPPPTMPLFDSRSDVADDGQSAPYNTYLNGGETYSFTFDTPGTYFYRCELHPTQMRGQITVAEPTPTPTPTLAPTPTPQPSPGPSPQPTPQPSPQVLSAESTPSAGPEPVDVLPVAVPAGGGEPPSDGGASVLSWLTLAGGGLLVATAALALRRLHR